MTLTPEIQQAIDQEASRFKGHLEQLLASGDGSASQPYQIQDPSQQFIILRILEEKAMDQQWVEPQEKQIECITTLKNTKLYFEHLPKVQN